MAYNTVYGHPTSLDNAHKLVDLIHAIGEHWSATTQDAVGYIFPWEPSDFAVKGIADSLGNRGYSVRVEYYRGDSNGFIVVVQRC